MKILKKINLLFVFMFVLTVVGCSSGKDQFSGNLVRPEKDNYWDGDYESSTDDFDWDIGDTDVTITDIGKNDDLVTKEEELDDVIDNELDVYGKIFSNLKYSLESVGFDTATAAAFDVSNTVVNSLFRNEISSAVTTGILYYTDQNIYDTEGFYTGGFFEILKVGEPANMFDDSSEVVILNLDEPDGKNYVHTYVYEDVGFDHFVSDDKYITYYFESDTVIRYNIEENNKENYNYMYGSLFNYDTNRFIYDEHLYDYQPQSGTSAMTPADYEKLQSDMKELVKEQNKAGYNVEEVNVVYISPEAIAQYIQSDEVETFFGYNVDELTAEFGLGTALEYKDGNLFEAEILDPNAGDYNWKSFLSKVAIGTGIILVGAVLTPLTGGTSFGCALVTIANTALTFAKAGALTTFAMNTISGLINGQSFFDALKHGMHGGLDAFANGFMIGAVIGSVGVVSGIIKPTACFVSGTMIATVNGLKPIENISIGDEVYSMNENTKKVSSNAVSDVFVSEVNELTYINIDGQDIISTTNHPYYSATRNSWVKADSLRAGDFVVNSNNQIVEITSAYTRTLGNYVNVYNFTVENDHTYFVGSSQILVHNACDSLSSNYYRSKAGKTAKKNALDDILAGKDYYGLDDKYINFIQKNNRFPSFSKGDGMQVDFAHAIDVKVIKNAFKKGLISKENAQALMANPNNGILVARDVHLKILHGGNFNNPTDIATMVKMVPKVGEFLLDFIF